jgi:hypothetical protein
MPVPKTGALPTWRTPSEGSEATPEPRSALLKGGIITREKAQVKLFGTGYGAARVGVDPPPLRRLRSMGSSGHRGLRAASVVLLLPSGRIRGWTQKERCALTRNTSPSHSRQLLLVRGQRYCGYGTTTNQHSGRSWPLRQQDSAWTFVRHVSSRQDTRRHWRTPVRRGCFGLRRGAPRRRR